MLPEAARSQAGYRLFGPQAVARGRLVRTLRELGVGLNDVKRVVRDEASLADVAAAHARALDAQIQTLRMQRAVLRAVAQSTDPQELKRMTDLTTLTGDERRTADAQSRGQPGTVDSRPRRSRRGLGRRCHPPKNSVRTGARIVGSTLCVWPASVIWRACGNVAATTRVPSCRNGGLAPPSITRAGTAMV